MFLFKYVNNKYKQTNFYKNQFIDVEKFTSSIPKNLEIVNLGSNHPKFAFDYSEADISGMNWAIGPQSFEYDLRILKKFHGFLKEKAFVIIPVCPLNFFLYRYAYDSINYKYYNILAPEEINNYSKKTRFLHIDYPILTAKRNLVRLVKDVPANTQLNIATNPMNNKELVKDANNWIKGWLQQFSLNDLGNISLSTENKNSIEKNIDILNEMIDFCLEKNYRPIIMMLPVTKALSSLFPQSFIDEYIVENIKKANMRGIPVVNYLNDARFISPDLYFNSFFMNAKGRKIFTNAVVKELKNLHDFSI
jgi:hypothetical protein